jgi:chitinase
MRRGLWTMAILAAPVLSGCGDDDDTPTGGDDFLPPTVTLTAPADSAVMGGPRSIDFQATATDNVGVRLVVFYFDGELVAQDVEGSNNVYAAHWNNEPLVVGNHTAVAEAIDWANQKARDTSLVIVTEAP